MIKSLTAPFVCFVCRKRFLRIWDGEMDFRDCPECGAKTMRYHPKFKVPKKTDEKGWKKVEFLRDHGFYFQPIYHEVEPGIRQLVNYPKDMQAAKEFVIKYGEYAAERKSQ